jgi:CubicO group peptidase (beta-lactamase class C family)
MSLEPAPVVMRTPIGAAMTAEISEEIQAATERWATPAIAVCVRSDQRVLYQAAHGWADAAQRRAATPRTRFALASVSKSLGAIAALLLVVDGRLQFDMPMRDALPELRLVAADADSGLTLRDLLSHRSGLPRHDAVWYGSASERPGLLERMRHLAPALPMRAGWQYQNLMYMALTLLIERASGQRFESFPQERVLAPLGMTRVNFGLADMLADPDHALPYRMGRGGELLGEAYQRVDAIGAAGALNASLEDLSAYVAMLSRGGAPLVAPTASAELLQPDARVPLVPLWPELAATHYGMGFFVTHYRGHRLVHHGGNLTGSSCLVAFLPDQGVALGILSNGTRSPVRDWLAYRIIDRVLGLPAIDWSARYWALREATLASEARGEALAAHQAQAVLQKPPALPSYAGEYRHPGYGSAQVAVHEGALQFTFNGFATPLVPVAAETFDTPGREYTIGKSKLRFLRNVFGDLTGLELHLEPALPGQFFSRQRPADDRAGPAPEGIYRLPGQRVQVLRAARGLTWQVIGHTPRVGLQPLGAGRFALEGSIDKVVSFGAEAAGVTDPYRAGGAAAGVLLQTRSAALFGEREA